MEAAHSFSSVVSRTLSGLSKRLREPAVSRKSARGGFHYDSADFYRTLHPTQTNRSPDVESEFSNKPIARSLLLVWRYLLTEQTWLFLVILGISVAMIVIALDFAVDYSYYVRAVLVAAAGPHWWLQLLIFALFNVSLCIAAGLVVRYVSPQSAGSGIPEMKSILSGVVLPRYLNYRTFLAKVTALTLALSGGLSIGREGPTVHIAAIVANQLSKIHIFQKIRMSEAIRHQMLSAGCAVGVAAIFGAPVGGVLFSIEVTSTYYLVSNMWRCFFCAVAGALVASLFGSSGLAALFSTNFRDNPYQKFELVIFAFIGASCGYLGSLFVRSVLKLVFMRRQYKILAETRYVQLVLIGILTACITFPLELRNMQDEDAVLYGDKQTLFNLFGEGSLGQAWLSPSIFVTLSVFFLLKWFFTALSLGLPIPCGLYSPVFVMGAAYGRFVGEVTNRIVGLTGSDIEIIAGGYAVVGAAGLSAGVTRTLSTAVIVFELTGQLEHFMPVLVAVLIATGVGNYFTRSAYDALLEQKCLPYMPPFGNLKIKPGHERAGDMMKRELKYFTEASTYLEVSNLLDNSHYDAYPLVDSHENMVLKATIRRNAMEGWLEKRDNKFKQHLETELLQDLGSTASREENVRRLREQYSRSFMDDAPQQAVQPNAKVAMDESIVDLVLGEGEEYGPADSPMDGIGGGAGSSGEGGPATSSDSGEREDEEEVHMESLLAERREQFFDVPITSELARLSDRWIDRSPFQIPVTTEIYKLHFIFSMLGLTYTFVTENARLVGVISKKQFLSSSVEE